MTSIVLFSTVLTLLITLVQLYRDYNNDIDRIEAQLQQVEDVHLQSLSALLWTSDTDELKTLADGIMRLRDMQYLEVRDEDKQWAVVGAMKEDDVILREYPITYPYKGKDISIGTLKLAASLDGVYERLYDKVITILVSNGIKTFLVAIFIFFIFHYLVTRHIVKIAAFTRAFDINNRKKLVLDRKQHKADELDDLVYAYNEMQSRQASSIDKLHESNARYRSLVEYSNAIPWELDLATFRFTYVGKQAEQVLGYPLRDWYQANFWVNHIHDEDSEYVIAYCRKRTEQGADHEFEYRMRAADDSIVWIHDDVIVVKDNGVPVRLQGFMFDVTEQKKARQALQLAHGNLEEKVAERTQALMHAKDEAERANQLKTEFLSRVSHELRTPMNAILGFAQLLRQEQLESDQLDSVDEIMRAGKHLLYVIDDVLDLSIIETGNINLSFEDFHLRDCVDECLALVQPMAGERGIKVDVDLHSCSDMYLHMDRERLKEVVVNLLTNAIKYNHDNGHIYIQCEQRSDSRLRISIVDTGPGLTQEQQSVMFEPFNRLGAEYTNTNGTGIGLTISRRLMELMGGAVGVHSLPGNGTTFWIDCNLSPTIIRVDSRGKDGVDINVPIISDACKVLCIEDNPANMRLIEKILYSKPMVALYAATTAEAGLELARREIPGVILMDINLPGVDGYEALLRLRNYSETRHIPVIAISAAAAASDIERGRMAGFQGYVTKPINVVELLESIERVVNCKVNQG